MIRLVGGPLDGREVDTEVGPVVPIAGTEISITLTDAESGHETLTDQWTVTYFVREMDGTAHFVRESPGPPPPFGSVIERPILRRPEVSE
jgi:hypothetical protein